MARTARTTALTVTMLAALTLTLAGCGDDEKTAAAPAPVTSSAASDAVATPIPTQDAGADAATDNCPVLPVGTVVEDSAFAACVDAALTASAGYTATGTVLGAEATVHHDPARDAFSVSTVAGDVIVIGSEAWVRPAGGSWAVALTSSPDAAVAELSTYAVRAMDALPRLARGGFAGDLTVTAADATSITFHGAQSTDALSVDGTWTLTPEYAPLSIDATITGSVNSIGVSLQVTEWDVEQNIVAPL